MDLCVRLRWYDSRGLYGPPWQGRRRLSEYELCLFAQRRHNINYNTLKIKIETIEAIRYWILLPVTPNRKSCISWTLWKMTLTLIYDLDTRTHLRFFPHHHQVLFQATWPTHIIHTKHIHAIMHTKTPKITKSTWNIQLEVKVIWQKAPHGGPRGHPRGSKVVPLNSWGRVSY